jgi:ATP-binding cassette subfamily C (CFTR/MRP) protein 1
MWLLERQLGLAFLAPADVAFISTTEILLMAKHIGKAQKTWIQGIQTRVDVTASMLASNKVGVPVECLKLTKSCIQGVKMLGSTDTVSGIVQTLRVFELRLSKLYCRLMSSRNVLMSKLNLFNNSTGYNQSCTVPPVSHPA